MKRNTNREKVILTVFWAGSVLTPVVGQTTQTGGELSSSATVPSITLSQSKVPSVRLSSARDRQLSAARVATGDAFDAVGAAQDSSNVWLIDEAPDTHTFGTGVETAGSNLLSAAEMQIFGNDFGPGAPDTNFVQVNYFTADGSDIVPDGVLSPNGVIYSAWRLDVGTSAAGANRISVVPDSAFTVVESGFCLLADGNSLGCVDLAEDDSNDEGVAGVGAAGLNGDDIAGFGVDELIMYWVIQVTPACGDGQVDAGEECDDGNTTDNDGCSSTCQIEPAPVLGDLDGDNDVDLADHAILLNGFTGPA